MKPKKSVMPPALKAYWKKHRRGKTKSRTRRRRNPKMGRMMFKFEIQKGRDKLCLLKDGKHFGKVGPYQLFQTGAAVQAKANQLAREFPILSGWRFYATPTHTYV